MSTTPISYSTSCNSNTLLPLGWDASILVFFLQTSVPLSSCGSFLAMSLSSSSMSCLWAFTMSSSSGFVFLTACGHLPSGTALNMFFPLGTVGGYKRPKDAFPTSQLESVARPASF